jgi:23S rRNA-/tRNA-specific pseudouridylate synthase
VCAGPRIEKFYHALVEDSPSLQPAGAIGHELHPVSSGSGFVVASRSSSAEEAGQPARTLYRMLSRSPREAALLELQPLTGARCCCLFWLSSASVQHFVS